MSSISLVNPGVADLLRTFSLRTFSRNGSSPLFQTLSSTQVQSAVEAASPGDLVQLSAQAVRLQQVAGLFGSAASPETPGPDTALPPALTSQNSEGGDVLAREDSAPSGSNLITGPANSTISLFG